MSTKRLLGVPLLVIGLMSFTGTAHAQEIRPLKQNEQLIEKVLYTVSLKYSKLSTTAQQVEDLRKKKQALALQLEQEKNAVNELRQKIAEKKAAEERAKVPEVVAPVVATASTPAPVQGPRYSCGDNEYAAFIYGMESGGRVVGNCDPMARNADGCLGIGQACPGSKLLAVCPNLDYNCQNAFFTSYAISRYGSWANAYEAWKIKKWW